ncbi:MAG: hypothetical protein ACRD13_10555 [Terriglobales bacterium]
MDSSVLPRKLLRQPGSRDLSRLESAAGSELVAAECYRALDRLRLHEPLSGPQSARLYGLAIAGAWPGV